MGLSGLDSNKCRAILRYKNHLGEQLKAPLPIIVPEKPKGNKRVDEFGEIAVSYLNQPYRIEFSKDEIDEIISQYQAGKSTQKIGEQFHCSKPTISNLLKQNGITVTNRKAQKKLDTKRIIIMYEKMQTTEEIAKEFDVSSYTINRCLRENGVKLRNRWDYIKN